MWPQLDQVDDLVVSSERAVDELYRAALTQWQPQAMSAGVPVFVGAITAAAGDEQLPPDPAAVEAGQGWAPIMEATILAGVSAMFASAVVAALGGLGISLPGRWGRKSQESAANPLVAPRPQVGGRLPDLGKQAPVDLDPGLIQVRPAPVDVPSAPDSVVNAQDDAPKPQVALPSESVLETVAAAAGVTDDDVRFALTIVEDTPALAAARDELVQAQRRAAEQVPVTLSRKMAQAVADVPLDADSTATMAARRDAAREVLAVDGDTMQGIAQAAGSLSAAVQNYAVLAAASMSDEPGLEKVWICTLDARTRNTHWAADGLRVPLASPFHVGADQLMYPADPSGSMAEIAGCRCRMGILAPDEPLPDEVDRHTERLNGRDSVAIHRDGRTQAEEIQRRAADGNTRARDNQAGVGTFAATTEGTTTMTTMLDGDTVTKDGETFLTFTDALFAVTGVPTVDGRLLASDMELTFRDTPMPLQWQEFTDDGHKRSCTVGVVESLRRDGDKVLGSGYMLNNDNAVKAIDVMKHGVNRPSIDMGNATARAQFADGTIATEQNYQPGTQVFQAYTKGTVTACTIVAIAAFGETSIKFNAERETRDVALVASAAAWERPVYDPAMFADADPDLRFSHRLTVDKATGHVHGFIATWKDQHRAVGLGNIRPPRSFTGYEHFHTSPAVELSDGTLLPVGRLTVGIGHASTDPTMSAAAAQSHYDNVEACWALGRISEHRLGIYFSGVVAPWASPEKVQMGLASPVSGDWRPLGPRGRNLELVAVLSVNTPGYLSEVQTDANGHLTAMVASLGPVVDAGEAAAPSYADIEAAVTSAVTSAMTQFAAATELASRQSAMFAQSVELVGEYEEPAPVSPEERQASLAAVDTAEFAKRRVRNSSYWGLPVGTVITDGMKPKGDRPRGKRQRQDENAAKNPPKAGSVEAAARQRAAARSAKSDAAQRNRDRDAIRPGLKSTITPEERAARAKANADAREKVRANEDKLSAHARAQPGRPKLKPGVAGRSFEGMTDEELADIEKTGAFKGKYDRAPKKLSAITLKQAKAEIARRAAKKA